MKEFERMPAKKMANELVKVLKHSRPDYIYLSEVFKNVRKHFDVKVERRKDKLPFVPTDVELKRFYDVVWAAKNKTHSLMVKIMAYTGVRVSELISIKIDDVDIESCQIRIIDGKGGKDRRVPFPPSFKEILTLHINGMKRIGAKHLFESSWKRPFSAVGVRQMIAKYSKHAEISQPLSPHKFRHYLLTYLKKQGLDDAMIQPYSGHSSRKSLEIYSRLSLSDAQEHYNESVKAFPI